MALVGHIWKWGTCIKTRDQTFKTQSSLHGFRIIINKDIGLVCLVIRNFSFTQY